MQQKKLTKQRERAALLVAEDQRSDEEIAREIGIDRVTLHRWKKDPVFAARVEQVVIEYRERIVAEGIANRQNRIGALNDRWRRMKHVIEERATDPDMEDVPGGSTGLLVRTYKQVGYGENTQLLPEYAVDTGTLRELRAHEEQAAKELGQWEEKQHHSGELFIRRYVGVDIESV